MHVGFNEETVSRMTLGEAQAACLRTTGDASLLGAVLHGDREAFDLLVSLCARDPQRA